MEQTTVPQVVLSDSDFHKIRDLVYQHCGINLHEGKRELVRARMAKRLRVGKFNSIQEYLKFVMEDKTGNEFSLLIDSLSTNVTSFFREEQHFEFLSNKYLPDLLARKNKRKNFKIRTWSAGCSSGEEPYSIAITLLEAAANARQWDIKVLATDISTSILKAAKAGIYDQESIAPVGAAEKNKYLILNRDHAKQKSTYEVSKSLRDIVVFRYLNLMGDWPFRGPLDFIFCRNVMIYFDKPTQERLINRYWDMLDSGGIFFTGHSESLTGIKHKFDYLKPTIYVKP